MLHRAGTGARSIETVAGRRLEEDDDTLALHALDLPELGSLSVLEGRAAATVGGRVHVQCSCGLSACLCGERP